MWRVWNAEQRVAAVASVLLIVSTFGRFPTRASRITLTVCCNGENWKS